MTRRDVDDVSFPEQEGCGHFGVFVPKDRKSMKVRLVPPLTLLTSVFYWPLSRDWYSPFLIVTRLIYLSSPEAHITPSHCDNFSRQLLSLHANAEAAQRDTATHVRDV